MAPLAMMCALVMALCLGYWLGRRAGSTPLTWKRRTSRIALGRLAVNLLVLLTARRIRRGFAAERVLPDPLGVLGLRFVAPVALLRGSLARMRSY
ncbi:MAG: hypothetical protein JOZ00_07850 [Mycobacterium sp.]|uniref:hypothetical protein n=1 Tax=Mycobacterium sp. TaxID=1785 RepID=UPI001EC30163|nr:hypothetical protein [Mycobacterium sp.]MBV8786588.1 hypothetical protein [Mycobacterium sp.]